MNKLKKALIFFVLVIILFLVNPISKLTGSFVSLGNERINIFYILGVICFIIGLLILAGKESLDAIIILGCPYKERIKERSQRALKEHSERGTKIFVATGGKTPSLPSEYKHEAQMIYEQLRAAGIKPVQIRIDGKAQDTLENITNSLKKIDGKKIGIVSNAAHLDRVEYIIKKAKQYGEIDKDIEIYRIEAPTTFTDRMYEIPAGILTRYMLRKQTKSLHKKDSILKKVVNYIFKK